MRFIRKSIHIFFEKPCGRGPNSFVEKKEGYASIPVYLNRFRNLDERLGVLVEPPELKTESQNFPGTVVSVGVGEMVGVGTGVMASSSADTGAL